MNYFECLYYMSYIYMGKHHKEDSSGWGISSGRVQIGGVSPRTVQLGGAALDGKIHFPLMTKGGRFIRGRI
jgi:hypothetical protein